MKRVALIGMPNTGKSTFFNRVTGASARVGNWPGITVDLLTAKILLGGDMVEIVDLPGIYDIHGFSDDERVVRQLLETAPIDLVAIVLNAVQIDRQLALGDADLAARPARGAAAQHGRRGEAIRHPHRHREDGGAAAACRWRWCRRSTARASPRRWR